MAAEIYVTLGNSYWKLNRGVASVLLGARFNKDHFVSDAEQPRETSVTISGEMIP